MPCHNPLLPSMPSHDALPVAASPCHHIPQVPHVYLDSQLPMIIKPFPWTSVQTGGYFTNDLPVMRTRGDHLQLERLLDADQETKVRVGGVGMWACGHVGGVGSVGMWACGRCWHVGGVGTAVSCVWRTALWC